MSPEDLRRLDLSWLALAPTRRLSQLHPGYPDFLVRELSGFRGRPAQAWRGQHPAVLEKEYALKLARDSGEKHWGFGDLYLALWGVYGVGTSMYV
jgi:hypothetical protein